MCRFLSLSLVWKEGQNARQLKINISISHECGVPDDNKTQTFLSTTRPHIEWSIPTDVQRLGYANAGGLKPIPSYVLFCVGQVSPSTVTPPWRGAGVELTELQAKSTGRMSM